jgi:hypothetical protein
MAGNRFGGNEYGGGKFGGKRFGGLKTGKSAADDPKEKRGDPGSAPAKSAMNEASKAWKPKAKTNWAGAGGNARAMAGAGGKTTMTAEGGSSNKVAGGGHVRGWTSSATAAEPKRRQSPVGPMGHGVQQRRGSAKAAPSYGKTPDSAKMAMDKPKASKPSYKAKGVADYNKDLGAIYLNATSNMFSPKAGGNKGKKK